MFRSRHAQATEDFWGLTQVGGAVFGFPRAYALLLRAGEVVSAAALTAVIWDDLPPPGAKNTLQGHIRRLRQALGPAAERIVTRFPGYLIEAGPGELDLADFTRLREKASDAAAAGSWERAASLLRQALALWDGDPLSNVASGYLSRTEVPRLTELHDEATSALIDADLHLGRHGAVTAKLRTELGIDPGPRLRALHAQILRGDPALDLRAPFDEYPGRTPQRGESVQMIRFLVRAYEAAGIDGRGLAGDVGVPASALHGDEAMISPHFALRLWERGEHALSDPHLPLTIASRFQIQAASAALPPGVHRDLRHQPGGLRRPARDLHFQDPRLGPSHGRRGPGARPHPHPVRRHAIPFQDRRSPGTQCSLS